MIAKMKRALDLTSEQQQTVIPLIEDLSASRRAFNRERRLVMMRLRPLAEDGQATDAEIRETLERLRRAETEFREKEARSLEAVRAALTPRQEAKFVLFLERFRREIQERLERFRRRMDGAGGPGPPRRPRNRPGAYDR